MGRPPYFVSSGVRKGPWTPEEDIVLASYIQEHGRGNWRSVPMNTGLRRCSKSCRLRWTNYLRPGIKRGNFTEREEKVIIDLQALLGNRWAAIASYLPQRTDHDIKNYWNTHLKKKLQKLQEQAAGDNGGQISSNSGSAPKGQWERNLQTDLPMARHALSEALSTKTSTQITYPPSPPSPPPPPFVNLPKKYSAGASSLSIRAPTNSYLLNSDNIVPSAIHTSAPPPFISNTDNILGSITPPSTTPFVSNTKTIFRSEIPTPLIPCAMCAKNYIGFSQKSSWASSQQNVSLPNEETIMVEGNLYNPVFSCFNSGNSKYSNNSAGGVSSETILYPDESKPCLGDLGQTLASIENWLLDDATGSAAQGQDAIPINMPFGEYSGPF